MLNTDDRHLTDDEFEALAGSKPAGQPGPPAVSTDTEYSVVHLAGCRQCSARAAQYAAAHARLFMLKSSSTAHKGNLCPADEKWINLAAGVVDSRDSEELLRHAIECDYCSAVLRQFKACFSDSISHEELSLIEGLSSSKPDWQEQLVSRLSALSYERATEKESLNRRFQALLWRLKWGMALAVALAVALVLAASGWWLMRSTPEARAQTLIAEAYTQQRTLEMRVSGARYAPLRQERGPEGSPLSRPAPLLEAEVLVSKHLRITPNNAGWLEEKARVELLEWQYSEAIRSLERARGIGSSSAMVLCDLATAYYERGRSEDQPRDFAKAVDLLGEAIQQKPDTPILFFNRAIANEALHLYDEALADWDKFIRLEPASGWSDEGKARRNAVLEKLNSRSRWNLLLHRNPGSAIPVLQRRFSPNSDQTDWPDSLDEAYLDIALAEWLPLFSLPSDLPEATPSASDERKASEVLAAILLRYHHDKWLDDFLKEKATPNWLEGVRSLGDALRSNRAGNTERAWRSALMAERMFRSVGSNAGRLRARYESVVAMKGAEKGPECLAAAIALGHQLLGRAYFSIEIGNILETSSCYGLSGDAGKAQHFANRAVRSSRDRAYGYLYLRSLCYDDGVGIDAPNVSTPEAWNRVSTGLGSYWTGPHQPLPAMEFFADMGFLAESSEYWNTAEGVGREEAVMAKLAGNQAYEAAAHHWLAQVAQMAEHQTIADAEFKIAGDILKTLPQSAPLEANWATLELERTSLEIDRGDYEKAFSRLQQLRPEVSLIADSMVAVLYYRLAGELYLRQGDLGRAEKALRTAIYVSEVGLVSLPQNNDTGRLAWDRQAGAAYRDLVELYFHTDPERALDLWEWYRAAALRRKQIGQEKLDFSALDANDKLPLIPKSKRFAQSLDKTVLSFALFPSGVAIWVLDQRGIYSQWVSVPEQRVRETAHKFEQSCVDPSSDVALLDDYARQLYNWLIAPVSQRISTADSLLVELDGPLSQIPIQALMNQNNEYLSQRFSIAISPGLYFLAEMKPYLRFSGQERALVVSNVVLSEEMSSRFPPLPDADQETRDLVERFKVTRILTGRQATAARLERELPRAEVVHFAGHAVVHGAKISLLLTSEQTGVREQPTLSFFDASRVKPDALRNTKLVVLSACETASADKGLQGSENLVRAFLRGAVPHVLASRWRVDSRATAEIIEKFYSRLLAGESVSGSLRAAEESVRLQRATAHPYYWAGFAAFGR